MISEPLSLTRLDIPVSGIYSAMGFRNVAPDEVSRDTTQMLLREAEEYISPQFEYLLLDGSHSDDKVSIGDVTFDAGHIISRQLSGSERYAVFVASVGNGWLKWMDVLRERDDVLQSFIADCIGSQIVESCADYMEKVLQSELDTLGWHRTNRFSPGYCGWSVSQQPLLFSLFPEKNPCGISLTDSCLMMPVKSVSGIIGVGDNVRYLPYTCNICTMQMCFRRKR